MRGTFFGQVGGGTFFGQVRQVRQVGRGGDTDLYRATVSNNCVPLLFRIID